MTDEMFRADQEWAQLRPGLWLRLHSTELDAAVLDVRESEVNPDWVKAQDGINVPAEQAIHVHVHLDGKEIYRSVQSHHLAMAARNSRPTWAPGGPCGA